MLWSWAGNWDRGQDSCVHGPPAVTSRALVVPSGASPPDRVRLEGSWQDSHGWGVFKCMGTRGEGVAGGGDVTQTGSCRRLATWWPSWVLSPLGLADVLIS